VPGRDPSCAIATWGIATTLIGNTFATGPTPARAQQAEDVLALVNTSLPGEPPELFHGAESQAEFSFKELSFIATRRRNPTPNSDASKKRARRGIPR
jgi:hypothetical protein